MLATRSSGKGPNVKQTRTAKLTSSLVGPVAALRHSVAARRRGQAAPAVAARESVRVTRDQVTVLLVRLVAAVVVSVAAPSARDAAIQPARAVHLIIGALS